MARDRGAKGERWIVVHDGMPDHPKIEDLSDKAFRSMVKLWCYCGSYLTDGVVKTAAARKRASPAVLKELVAAELLEPCADGFLVHDYLDWQRSAAEVLAVVETKKEAGKRGNHERWHVARNIVDQDCEWCTQPDEPDGKSQVRPPDDVAERSHVRSQVRSQTDRRTGSQTIAETEAETETEVPGETWGADPPDADATRRAFRIVQ